jgi:excisionase family DNA binding protein
VSLLTARELAERWGVSPETVLRWTRRGELLAICLPSGALRYRSEDIEAWESARETGRARGEEAASNHPRRPAVRAMLPERATGRRNDNAT